MHNLSQKLSVIQFAVAQLGQPAPKRKKYSCPPSQQIYRVWSENVCKSAEEAKAEHIVVILLFS